MHRKLHEAMVLVLRDHDGVMYSEDLAREIAQRDLYRRKDGGHAPPTQLRARAAKYPHLLEASDDGSGRIGLAASFVSTGPAGLAVFCADVGSVRQERFGWARDGDDPDEAQEISRPSQLVAAVVAELSVGHPVALGFECPLFVPVPEDELDLGRARHGEGNRPWSAGAGTGAMATGLVQVAWVLREVRRQRPTTQLHARWSDLVAHGQGLFVWEAFVTAGAKGSSHNHDAAIAVAAFQAALPEIDAATAVTSPHSFSLVSAAALWSGWPVDLEALRDAPVVIRAAVP